MSISEALLSPSSPVGRWSGLGPYYAMFPRRFAFEVIQEHSPLRGAVLDPFAGRGTSVFAAATLGRTALGVEINPVGWIFGQAKLDPAPQECVLKRIGEVAENAVGISDGELQELPPFFSRCYNKAVLKYLLQARIELNWEYNQVDRTLMAIILVYLHGRRDQSLSNQMRQGKAMSPQYSIKWWDERSLAPPPIDPVAFLQSRVRWRYAKGVPPLSNASVLLGDCTFKLPEFAECNPLRKFDLLFTSPPYCGITNYHYDQWLRLWLLGSASNPTYSDGLYQSKFSSREEYATLLRTAFVQASSLLRKGATVYVRTDARKFTCETTRAVLCEVFPKKTLREIQQPYSRKTQTSLFGDKREKPGEVDFLLM